jgi:hypothetical protein
MTASWAFLVLIPSLLVAWDTTRDKYPGWTTANAVIIAAVQVALILASSKAYVSMKRDRSDIRILMPPLAVALVVLTCLMTLVIRFGHVRY